MHFVSVGHQALVVARAPLDEVGQSVRASATRTGVLTDLTRDPTWRRRARIRLIVVILPRSPVALVTDAIQGFRPAIPSVRLAVAGFRLAVPSVRLAVAGARLEGPSFGLAVAGARLAVSSVFLAVAGVGLAVSLVGLAVSVVGLAVAGFGLAVSLVRLAVAGFRLAIPSVRLAVAGARCERPPFRLAVAGFSFAVPSVRMPVTGARFAVPSVRLAVAGARFEGSSFRLAVAGFSLAVPSVLLAVAGARLAVPSVLLAIAGVGLAVSLVGLAVAGFCLAVALIRLAVAGVRLAVSSVRLPYSESGLATVLVRLPVGSTLSLRIIFHGSLSDQPGYARRLPADPTAACAGNFLMIDMDVWPPRAGSAATIRYHAFFGNRNGEVLPREAGNRIRFAKGFRLNGPAFPKCPLPQDSSDFGEDRCRQRAKVGEGTFEADARPAVAEPVTASFEIFNGKLRRGRTTLILLVEAKVGDASVNSELDYKYVGSSLRRIPPPEGVPSGLFSVTKTAIKLGATHGGRSYVRTPRRCRGSWRFRETSLFEGGGSISARDRAACVRR